MNAKDAIEELRERQLAMTLEAQMMEKRASRLQAIAECQDPQGGGYRWVTSRVDLTNDGMKANRIVLKCAKSGVRIEAILVHPPPLTILDEWEKDIELNEFLSEKREIGDEEE